MLIFSEGHRDPQGPTGTHSIVPCRGSRMSGSLLCVVNLDFSGNFRSWGSTCMSSGYQARHHEIQEMLHWLLHDNGWEMLRVWKFMWLMVQNRLSNRDLQDELKHLSHARHQIGTTQVMESWPSRVGLRQLLLKSFHAPRKHYPCHETGLARQRSWAMLWHDVQRVRPHAAFEVFASFRLVCPMRSRTTFFAFQRSFKANQLSVATFLDCSSMGNQTDTETWWKHAFHSPKNGGTTDCCPFQHQSSQFWPIRMCVAQCHS